MAKSLKGGQYERTICGILSRWLTAGERDDCFWRTANSGGRATSRKKRGKKTAGHDGDICATDDAAVPFLKLFAVEIKRGYSKTTVMDTVDRHDRMALQEWMSWVHQVVAVQERSDSLSWLLIHRRDQREALVFYPTGPVKILLERPCPSATFLLDIHGEMEKVNCCKLTDFLDGLDPADIPRMIA